MPAKALWAARAEQSRLVQDVCGQRLDSAKRWQAGDALHVQPLTSTATGFMSTVQTAGGEQVCLCASIQPVSCPQCRQREVQPGAGPGVRMVGVQLGVG